MMLLMSCTCCAGITDAPLYEKTDKSKPMGANVALSKAIGGQPTERGASPILYAAACENLAGVLRCCCPCALSTGLFLLHLPPEYLFDRQTHLPRLLQHACMHCEAGHVLQARGVHSLEARQGHSCPSAISTNSRTGPPSQVHILTQVLALILTSCQQTATIVHVLTRRLSMAAPGFRPGPQICLLIA